MKAPRPAFLTAGCRALAGLAAAGCAHPAAPPPQPAGAPEAAAVAQARRDERLRMMEEYWEWSTASPPEGPGRPGGAESLEYPAGNYGGINFAPRAAADPSLAEPPRG